MRLGAPLFWAVSGLRAQPAFFLLRPVRRMAGYDPGDATVPLADEHLFSPFNTLKVKAQPGLEVGDVHGFHACIIIEPHDHVGHETAQILTAPTACPTGRPSFRLHPTNSVAGGSRWPRAGYRHNWRSGRRWFGLKPLVPWRPGGDRKSTRL